MSLPFLSRFCQVWHGNNQLMRGLGAQNGCDSRMRRTSHLTLPASTAEHFTCNPAMVFFFYYYYFIFFKKKNLGPRKIHVSRLTLPAGLGLGFLGFI